MHSWIRTLFSRPVVRPFRKAPVRARPALEVLEDRWVPSIIVNNSTDTPVAGETDLREAIAQANTNGGDETITFDPTVFATAQTITLTQGQLELTDTTGTETITGPAVGVTVNGAGLSRVFQVDASVTASLSGLTISGGNAGYGDGGGLLNLGTTTLTNCTLRGNSAVNGGGLATPSLTISSATSTTGFTIPTNNDLIAGLSPTVVGDISDVEGLGTDTTGNSLTDGLFGPPGLIEGGPNPEVVAVHNGVTLTYTLPNNGGLGYNISAIDIYTGWRDGGRVNQDLRILYTTTTNSTFTPLTTVHEAGQFTNPSDLATFVSNVGLKGVTAIQFSFPTTQNGYVGYRELVVTGTSGSSPVGPTTTLTNCTVSGNSATGSSGGLYNASLSTTSVTGTTVKKNASVTGGGISNQGTLNVWSSTIAKNAAMSGGGGIGSSGGGSATTVSYTIDSNFSYDQAGGILNQGSLTLTGDILSKNIAKGSAAVFLTKGGGLRSLDGTLTISGCTFSDNQSQGGQSMYGSAYGGAIAIVAGNATISNRTFTDNKAQGSDGVNASVAGLAEAGAIHTRAPLTITGCTFSGNSAVGGSGGSGPDTGNVFGGAILNFAPVSISVSECDHNEAIGGSRGNSGPGQSGPFVDTAFGGAISTGSFSVTITNTGFSHNQAIGGSKATASGTGGIVFVGVGAGGALDNEFGDGLSLSGCTLDHNQAIGGDSNTGSGGDGWGGGLIAFAGTVTMSNTTLDHNEAKGGDGLGGGNGGNGYGGGIYLASGASVSLAACTVTNNQALGGKGIGGGADGQGIGGGVYDLGSFTYDLATIIANNHASTSNNDIYP
jgi:hypothetical protein